ncbi:hypothetical protein CC1G_08683 [Coprinopsis cinerea okayama7|uniref:Secreted protein n=1 Tax=Coprinopsis cinerea (strain Okayama-7 / 130 / ATCC MYA-4618 / FGSC 9003) TaxID=240176 RepID=A8NZG0_COPC7|nr:hypothetical protein CC1G_08683 [Coprinopsis cinerea okayama7\|eukprot:XP_001837670.1 hypothetical protein CC1G_08683 [Coprinopsis cinerea okayama7\
MSSLFKTLALAFVAATAVVALPADVEDFVPGSGLPSLEELGMTKEDLYKPIPEEVLQSIEAEYGGLTKRWSPTCRTSGLVPYAGALACYNYLDSLGTTPCVVPFNTQNPNWLAKTTFCQALGAFWTGTCLAGTCVDHGSSYCRDVARGGLWVLTHCKNSNNQLNGNNAAWGNGNLIVDIQDHHV